MPRVTRFVLFGLAATAVSLATPAAAQHPTEWTAYGHDAQGTRYSPLSQIDRGNVSQLTVAWTYRTGETEHTHQPAKLETTPLMVDGILYLSTPFGRAIALDPATGRERWRFDAQRRSQRQLGRLRQPRRIDLGRLDASASARPAGVASICRRSTRGSSRSTHATGTLVHGVRRTTAPLDLRRGLHNSPFELPEYQLTSPPAIINGLLVTGSSVADNNRTNAASGEVRAFDARTGALRWTWDPVPRDSTDPQWATWRSPMAHSTGAANAWSVIAADPARDLVFVPTGSPSPDYYGGERLGDNRYANSIVALRASTGKVVWHFQTVHHDLWDYDNASPPLLTTITHEGRRVDVVLQATKTGQLFVLDRDDGPTGISRRRAPCAVQHDLRRACVADAAVQYGDPAAQPATSLARQHLVGATTPTATRAVRS